MDYTYELVGSFSWRVVVGKKQLLSERERESGDLFGCLLIVYQSSEQTEMSCFGMFSSLSVSIRCVALSNARSFLALTLVYLFDFVGSQPLHSLLTDPTDLFNHPRTNLA